MRGFVFFSILYIYIYSHPHEKFCDNYMKIFCKFGFPLKINEPLSYTVNPIIEERYCYVYAVRQL